MDSSAGCWVMCVPFLVAWVHTTPQTDPPTGNQRHIAHDSLKRINYNTLIFLVFLRRGVSGQQIKSTSQKNFDMTLEATPLHTHAHMALHPESTLPALLNLGKQCKQSELLKSPFTSQEGKRGGGGASSKPGHFPKKSLHPPGFKSPS